MWIGLNCGWKCLCFIHLCFGFIQMLFVVYIIHVYCVLCCVLYVLCVRSRIFLVMNIVTRINFCLNGFW